jgi:hypothetical protein
MATSGSKSVTVTSWDTLKFSWSEKSQSVANNTTTIDWKMELIATSSGRISSTASKAWTVKVNGTTYSGTNSISISNNATKTLASGTTTIAHNSDGTKSFSYSFSQTFDMTFAGSKIGTKSGSGTGTLDTIPRKSTMTVSNGTLGTAQTLTVTRQSTSFTHSIKAVCGNSTLYVKADGSTSTSEVKHNDCSIPFTPPLTWAAQNTTGTSVSVTFTITTYNGSTNVGYNAKTVSYTIPASVKPTCSIEVSDAMGYASTYGGMIKGLSKFKIVVTGKKAQNSPIKSYSVTANGSTYSSSNVTTDVIRSAGTQKITATVKDARGRVSDAVTESVTVLDYSYPTISRLTVSRCNEDGTANDEGKKVKVTISAAVTSLNGKNIPEYILGYKKSSSDVYTEVTLGDNKTYSLDTEDYFDAETGSSYDVRLIVKDNFTETSRLTTVSTAFAIMHWNAAGDGMGIGKVSELPNVLDIGMQTRFMGGILYPLLEPGKDLNDVKLPGMYVGENVTTEQYVNCPIEAGTFTLEVLSAGISGQVLQRLTRCDKIKPLAFQRYWYGGSWGHWFWAGTDEILLYENTSGSNGTITMTLNNDGSQIISASHFRYLEIYFTDNNGKSGGYTKVWQPNGKTVCLQITEPSSTIYSRQTFYAISGQTLTPAVDTASYYRITSAGDVTTSIGTNYIKIVRIVGRA